MEQYYYSSATGQTYSASQMLSMFGYDVNVVDVTILNLNGFYPVIDTVPDFDSAFQGCGATALMSMRITGLQPDVLHIF